MLLVLTHSARSTSHGGGCAAGTTGICCRCGAAACRARGGRVVAVGTTVVRALETAAAGGALAAMSGESRLFIRPGFEFRVVDAMLTNFHLPKSTLLMLVSAFAGYHRMRRAYQHAIAQQYRFFSYGDAMWMPCRGAPDHEI